LFLYLHISSLTMHADSKEAASDCRFGGLHSLGGGLWGRYLWPTLCILRNQRLAPRQTVGELVGAAGDVEMLKTLGRCLKVVVSHRCHGSGPCLRGKSSTWTRWMQNKNPLAGSWWLDMCSFGAVSQLTLLFQKKRRGGFNFPNQWENGRPWCSLESGRAQSTNFSLPGMVVWTTSLSLGCTFLDEKCCRKQDPSWLLSHI
jgi:hypothetical protein